MNRLKGRKDRQVNRLNGRKDRQVNRLRGRKDRQVNRLRGRKDRQGYMVEMKYEVYTREIPGDTRLKRIKAV